MRSPSASDARWRETHDVVDGRDDRILRRTQTTIAVVRIGFALIVGAAVAVVWAGGTYSGDEYSVPGTDWTYPLWEVFAAALAVLAVVFIGGVGELGRARRGRRFDP